MGAEDGQTVTGWFDSHCHIQETYLPEGADESGALAAAAGAGVSSLVCIGTDASSSRQAVALVERARVAGAAPASSHPGLELWATVGLHPHEASHGVDETVAVLDQSLEAHPGVVVAVGECGLDYHYDHSPRDAQRAAFEAQIELARQRGLALVVHSREAWPDTLAILRRHAPERVVLHCFTGGAEEARQCLDLGAFISFSGIATFKTAEDVRDAARLCPLDRLLIETDAPFLAPVPHRGRPNEPALVAVVGEALSAVKDVTAAELARTSAAAARAVFGL